MANFRFLKFSFSPTLRFLFLLIPYTIFLLNSSCRSKEEFLKPDENLKWYDQLPHCPCENPDFHGDKVNDGWAREKTVDEMGFFQKLFSGKRGFAYYHPGAAASFRSYPYVVTHINGRKFKSGQQCCYDAQGKLIITGPPAGTPDKWSPAIGENKKGLLKVNIFRVRKHVKFDSSPWKAEEWKDYHRYWPPDKGVNCN